MVVIPKLDGGLKREELKEPHRALLTRGTQEATDRYKQVEWCAALAVAEAKIQVWEQLGEVMQQDFWFAWKQFWQTVSNKEGRVVF